MITTARERTPLSPAAPSALVRHTPALAAAERDRVTGATTFGRKLDEHRSGARLTLVAGITAGRDDGD